MKKKLLILCIILFFIGAYWGIALRIRDCKKEVVVYSPNLQCQYYNSKSFNISINKDERQEICEEKVLGGIVTHHLLADKMIASFFKTLFVQKPDTEVVIIIGPNHKRLGRNKIHTGNWDWETPFGILKTDKNIVSSILENFSAEEDYTLLQEEHSISSLIPYVKYYFPDAKVVSILLHGNLETKASEMLADKILDNVKNKKYIIIGSVDFSHYLPLQTAEKMDEITIKAIKENDIEAIKEMGNDNLDSPPTIITILKAMQKENAKGIKVLDHSNSAKITGTNSDNTTSYFTILFHK